MQDTMEGLTLESFTLPMASVGLTKSMGGTDDPWIIQGLASTPTEDQQGEVVLVKGLDLSYLDQGKGTFNWNHFGDKDPSSVIGLITEHQRTSNNELFVKGRLLKALPKAQAAYNLLKALEVEGETRRMGMSIEGKVLHRQNKVIYKAWVKAVALTMDPVNQDTYVSFAKSFAGAEFVQPDTSPLVTLDAPTLERALSIASSAVGTPNGRSVLSVEHLENVPKDLDWAGNKKKAREKMSKGYTYGEAIQYLKGLVPNAPDALVDGLVRFAFYQQEHTR